MANAKYAATIADLREMARRRLPQFAFVPMDTGSGDGSGPQRNQAAFRDVFLSPRALVDVNDPQQRVSLFGRQYASPFGISAIGYAGLLRRGADEMLAEAAVEADIPFMLSGGATASVEAIARIAPEHVWQQLYPARDAGITEDIVRRAGDAGVKVLVYTVDSPVSPRNDWLARTGIRLPAHVPMRAWPYVAWQVMTHPAWALDHGRKGGLPRLEGWSAYAPAGATASQVAGIFQKNVPNVQTWAALERIRAIWPGILVIKGIVHPEDARRALVMGADAITVSNHGGNKLDSMPGAIDVLPVVAHSIPEGVVRFFDGGIRKGSDVIAALALGADFCFVGRAALYGVIADGTRGAIRAIEIIRDDITRTLALIGCPDIAALSEDFIHRRLGPNLSKVSLTA